MKKTIFPTFLCSLLGCAAIISAHAQMDSSPLKSTLGTATRFAGGVDKDKVMDLFQDQQFDEAINYLSPVLRADSDNMPVLTYAGYAYYMEDNEALTYASRLLDLQPTKAVWWRTVGELWRRQQKPDSALSYLRRAYMLAPTDLKTISDLGSVLIDGRAYDEADSLLDTGLALDSMNISLLKLRVQGAYWSKHYGAALVPGERLLAVWAEVGAGYIAKLPKHTENPMSNTRPALWSQARPNSLSFCTRNTRPSRTHMRTCIPTAYAVKPMADRRSRG